ncbi:carboxymuconolactone decarboxylase family protein [Ectobacillus polymachus]|uniref:carboxymuconolactone decarboxylase family protein n=1 Tax=Ectobacillus polymachus TaxID=1508806 RepID=UPI003A8B145E
MGQEFYKKKYSAREFYVALYKGIRTIPYMVKNKRSKQISMEFIERIMLAVTEVNGCEICSYAHTKIALEQGMSNEEIQMLLSGNKEKVPEEEAPALLFAQHYADTKGNPSTESWQRIIDTYGKTKALGILGAIRAIMVGNVYGIPLSAFRSRLCGKPIQKSNFFYEITMILSILLFLPVALLHSLLLSLVKFPII